MRRGGRVQRGPEHPGKHITVSPVVAGQSQQLDQRLGFAQPPRGRNHAASDTNTEAAQQRYMQRARSGRHIHTALACHAWSLRPQGHACQYSGLVAAARPDRPHPRMTERACHAEGLFLGYTPQARKAMKTVIRAERRVLHIPRRLRTGCLASQDGWRWRGTRFPGSVFVVVPACGDADLVLSDLIHQAVLVGDAP